MHDHIPIFVIVSIIFVVTVLIAVIPDEATRQARLRAKFEQELTRLAEEAELTRAEVAVIQAQTARDQVLARVQYLRSLSKKERGLLEARLRASAEAEAQALCQLNQLEAQNRQLTHQLAVLTWDSGR